MEIVHWINYNTIIVLLCEKWKLLVIMYYGDDTDENEVHACDFTTTKFTGVKDY